MTSEEDLKMAKLLAECMEPERTVLHWFDILAIMIIGYWLGSFLTGFWWWL